VTRRQGCQMVYFQTKNFNLGNFWRVLQWKILIYFLCHAVYLRPFDIFYGHLVNFVVIWYIFPHFWATFFHSKNYVLNKNAFLDLAYDWVNFRLLGDCLLWAAF
jgi:hypothetical protein